MVYGVLLMINFAHGEIFMIGAYVGWGVLTALLNAQVGGLHPAWVVPLLLLHAMLVAGLLGVCLEPFAYRPLYLRGATRLGPLISAVGASIFLQNAVMVTQGARMKVYMTSLLFPRGWRIQVAGASISALVIVMIMVAGLMMWGLHELVQRTTLGRSIRAVAEDRETAAIMGVNVRRVIAVTFFLGPAPGGPGGRRRAAPGTERLLDRGDGPHLPVRDPGPRAQRRGRLRRPPRPRLCGLLRHRLVRVRFPGLGPLRPAPAVLRGRPDRGRGDCGLRAPHRRPHVAAPRRLPRYRHARVRGDHLPPAHQPGPARQYHRGPERHHRDRPALPRRVHALPQHRILLSVSRRPRSGPDCFGPPAPLARRMGLAGNPGGRTGRKDHGNQHDGRQAPGLRHGRLVCWRRRELPGLLAAVGVPGELSLHRVDQHPRHGHPGWNGESAGRGGGRHSACHAARGVPGLPALPAARLRTHADGADGRPASGAACHRWPPRGAGGPGRVKTWSADSEDAQPERAPALRPAAGRVAQRRVVEAPENFER